MYFDIHKKGFADMAKQKRLFMISLLLLLLSGCGMREELTDWAAEKANDALEVVGGSVQEAIDELENAEYQDGPFENNLESAREYLLTQISWNVICSCRQRQIKFISSMRNSISWMALMPAAIPWKI